LVAKFQGGPVLFITAFIKSRVKTLISAVEDIFKPSSDVDQIISISHYIMKQDFFENLIRLVPQLVEKFPSFIEPKFITFLTTVLHWALS
jgi:hypothetical protein